MFDAKRVIFSGVGQSGVVHKLDRSAIDSNMSAYRRLMNEFTAALDVSLTKVRWNYKTAIPVYFPRTHQMSMLLPLALVSDNQIDLALVVEKNSTRDVSRTYDIPSRKGVQKCSPYQQT